MSPAVGNDSRHAVRLGDLARVEHRDKHTSLAQVIGIERDIVALQLFAGTRGVSTDASVPAQDAFRRGDSEEGVRRFLDGVLGEGAFDRIPPFRLPGLLSKR